MVGDLMPRAAAGRWSMATALAVAVTALAIVGVALMTHHRPAGTGATTVSVVTAPVPPPAMPDRRYPSGAAARPHDGNRPSPSPAAGEIAALEADMAAGPRDQRTARDERRLLAIVRSTLPGLRGSTVTCAGPTCRIAGDLAGTVGPTHGYRRSVDFSDAIFALGYSPGPDAFAAQGADTAVLLYLRRG